MKYSLFFIFPFIILGCKDASKTHRHLQSAMTHTHATAEVSDYFGNYTINDTTYGTKTIVVIDGDTRFMTTNSLPNHKTGDFPNQGNPNTITKQNISYTFPIQPKYVGKAQWMREPGVALNGIKFEPGTAEVVACESGENYRVEALQNLIDLGLDFNHAHVQPTGAYHYHGTPESLIKNFDNGKDLVHIGFAHDGFPMYYSKSGKYKPSFKLLDGNREGEDCSYKNPHQKLEIDVNDHHDGTYGSDYEFIEGFGDLDECNGITIDGNYVYLVTKEFPYISRCLMGEVDTKDVLPQVIPGQRPQGPRNGQSSDLPSASELIKMMDSDNDSKISKKEAKGPLSQDFKNIDINKDGFLTEVEIEKGRPKDINEIPNRKGARPPKQG